MPKTNRRGCLISGRKGQLKIAVVCCLLFALHFSQAPARSSAYEPISDPTLEAVATPASGDLIFPGPGSKAIVHERNALDTKAMPIKRGDIVVETKSSPTGLAMVKPEEKQPVPLREKKQLQMPLWNQYVSKSGLLVFRAADKDILAFPIDGNGGPGTAARGDNQWRFSGPLAVGGFGLYGAAVQVNEEVNQILIYEAYERSHHQARIYRSGSPITWLGWAGENGEHLYFLQKDDGKEHLYRFEPTFPDPNLVNQACFSSNKPLTDCMMRAIEKLPRKVSPVIRDVAGIWVSSGEQPVQLWEETNSD